MTEAASAPLQDLNLSKTPIPPVLLEARKAPYAAPVPPACADLQQQILALDEVLGPDLDAPPEKPGDAGWVEQGSEAAGNAVYGALRSAAEGVVPLRGWVRKLSGAERHSESTAAAIKAGLARRSFLRGYAQAQACPPAREAAGSSKTRPG
ncbi:hypothetical protein G8A07_16500 [Roseateles sp. DAIF2]|nr:hypothetical protein G8A07_16500 [Roseateles sp. DAIF2]